MCNEKTINDKKSFLSYYLVLKAEVIYISNVRSILTLIISCLY